MTSSTMGMLQDVRVLDLSQFIPGPFVTLLMSDLGADVIKVEPPQGDPQIVDGPLDGEGMSLWYRIINRNKRIVRLDLKSEEDRRIMDELVRHADVLLESYRPGVLSRLGYGPERLAELNERLVHCALSGWGQNGPYRLRAGHDNNYQAAAGILAVSGTIDRPLAANPPVADFAGALNAFGLISAALFRRERTGRGAFIDIGMADAALSQIGPDLASLAVQDYDTRRGRGPYSGGWACYNAYRCACGGFVTIGALEPRFWSSFCEKVGRKDWIARQDEPLPQTDLISEVAKLISTRTRAEWVSMMSETDTCFHEVLELAELEENPQIAARKVLHKGADGILEALLPAWIDGKRPPHRRPYLLQDSQFLESGWADSAPQNRVRDDNDVQGRRDRQAE